VVRLFLGNRAGVILLLPFIIAGYLFLNNHFNYYVSEVNTNLGFWGESANLFPLINTIGAAIIIFINAFTINWIYNSNQFLERNSYLSSLLYVLLMSFYHSFYSMDGLLFAHTFLILMLFQFFKLNQHSDGKRHVFNGMFFGGMAATFHPPLIGLFPFLCIMYWVVRPFVLRELIIAIIGFGIPSLYAAVFLWYYGHAIDLKLLDQLTDYTNKQTDFLVTAVLFSLLFMLSIVSIRSRMSNSSIRLKKLTATLWWFLFVALILGCVDFFFFRQIERFSFLMLPLSIFLTFSFTNKTYSFVATLLFYITFGYSIVKFFF
jgi:hypothetical protein